MCLGKRRFRGDENAVVSGLTVDEDVWIAALNEPLGVYAFIGELKLLNTEDIRRMGVEEETEEVLTRVEGVQVPRDDFHVAFCNGKVAVVEVGEWR